MDDEQQQILVRLLTNSDRILDAAMKLGVAYAGYRSANHWTGSLNALIALKLAQSGNIVAGAAGVGVLTFIGLTQPGMLPETLVGSESPHIRRAYWNAP